MKTHILPYNPDSSTLFARLRHLPWAQYLDSSHPASQQGRYDIITALPTVTLETWGEITRINDGKTVEESSADPFELIDTFLHAHKINNTNTALPFIGGALGYFSYDLARRIERLPAHKINDIKMPEMAVGIYHWGIVVDHEEQNTQIVYHEEFTDLTEILTLLQQPEIESTAWKLTNSLEPCISEQEYADSFEKLHNYIYAGDCYEANYTQRYQAEFSGDPWELYQQLRQKNPVPFGAYLQFPFGTVLSCSPERFLHVNNDWVTTKPIKGTRARSDNPDADALLAQDLLNSEKDKAENLMIVDLMRHDLSKVCEAGSVRVPRLFALESFPGVHHLVSTVTGKLCDDNSSIDLLRACFPGGSITGAPKIRAMEIIAELEPYQRGIYCGSIAYVSFDGNMDSNITIRTLTCCEDKVFLNAGGAIVADSQWQSEYAECELKIARIRGVLAARGTATATTR